jgi:hypothetical protein
MYPSNSSIVIEVCLCCRCIEKEVHLLLSAYSSPQECVPLPSSGFHRVFLVTCVHWWQRPSDAKADRYSYVGGVAVSDSGKWRVREAEAL